MLTACHLWPAISPHGPEVPSSIWNLPYGVWLGIARAVDEYESEQKKANAKGGGR